MNRISTNLSNDNLQYHTRMRQVELNKSQNRMAAQTRILNLRDDPAGAAHASRHLSYLNRLNRFSNNIQDSINNYQISEGHLRHAVDILHEIRQISLEGANGIYSREDHSAMAEQVNQLLEELVNTGNAQDTEGTSIFAGSRTGNLPYRVIEGTIPERGGQTIVGVEYIGNIQVQKVEVADGQYVDMNLPGNKVFWAENQQLYSQVDALGYVAQNDSSISVNGSTIQVREGDNVYQIIARINESATEVTARLDPVNNGIILETTVPRQLWLSDESGTVLQDLGVINNSRPPHNIASDANLFGGSLFDSIIRLRDNLYQGNINNIGGDGLRAVDSSLGNLLSNLGMLGAQSNRMELAYKRTEKEIEDIAANSSRITDIDFTEALTEFSMLELTHRAALSVTARVIQPTLLDFLR